MRTFLRENTMLRVPGGALYKITGEPLGEGGGSIIYPIEKYIPDGKNNYTKSNIHFALKECYPVSSRYEFIRNSEGEILPTTEEAREYLWHIKRMQMAEDEISGKIYNTSFRLTPILESFQMVEISYDQGTTFHQVRNYISVMESLSSKGQSIKSCLKTKMNLPVQLTFRIIEQLLYAVREVHEAGFLHLDIQDGNVFVKGILEDNSGMVSLMDFGSARKRLEDGFCAQIEDGALYSTPGFSAPEILTGNNGKLRLGPQADLYSIGCLMLLLLTGHRYSTRELCANTTGKYIPRFALRKTKCPKFLVERMQAILTKALENDVADRYACVDDMLKDITEFLALLAPYRSPLTAVEYDAFICYKHGELDTLAAKELRNALERYKGSSLLQKKLIGRVFLDEGELASCADFGARIRDALKQSNWLVVVCSKDTKNSPWVNEEINTFLEFHDAAHILAVVIDGEPGEVFPDALLKNGMNGHTLLAADARAGDFKGVRTKIRGDVKLKIAAPMLHTTYDSLKQRNKIYQMKRISVLVCSSLLVLSAFLGYAAVKSRTIARQAIEISKEHKAAIQNQAKYLSQQAKESYENHDPVTAAQQALSANELLKGVGGFMSDIVYTVSEITGAYTIPANAAETMTARGIFDLSQGENGFDDYFLNGDGSYLFTADENQISIWDTDTFQISKTITLHGELAEFDEAFLVEQQTQYLAVLQDEIICYDYDREAEAWDFKLDEQIAGAAVSSDKSLVAAADSSKLYILDAKTGAVIQTSDFHEEEGYEKEGYGIEDTTISISPDNRTIAFIASKEDGEGGQYQFKNMLYNIPAKQYVEMTSFANDYPLSFTEAGMYFGDDGRLCLFHGTGMNTVYAGNVYKYYSEKKQLDVCVYDTDTRQVLWNRKKSYMSMDEGIQALNAKSDRQKCLLLIYADTCEMVDWSTGETLDLYQMDSPVAKAWREEDGFTLVLENGDLLEHSYGTERLVGHEYFPEKLDYCCRAGDCYYVRKREEDSFSGEPMIVKYQAEVYNTEYESCGTLDTEFANARRVVATEKLLIFELLEDGKVGIYDKVSQETYVCTKDAYEANHEKYPEGMTEALRDYFSSCDTDGAESGERLMNHDEQYAAHIDGTSVVIENQAKDGKFELEFDSTPLSIFWMPDSAKLLVGLEDRAALYNASTEILSETEPFESPTAIASTWQAIDESTAVLSGDTYSYVLNVAGDSLGALYRLKNYITYDKAEDSFYFLSYQYDMERIDQGMFMEEAELGKLRRYSAEEILNRALKLVIQPFICPWPALGAR